MTLTESQATDGGFTVSSDFHGALCDELEGTGVLSTLPGAVDVPNPGFGPSVLEADRNAVLSRLAVLGWSLVDVNGEYWEDGATPYNEPVCIGGSWMLARVP